MTSLRALIVDDEQEARNRLRAMLTQLGVEIADEAADGQEAVEKIRASRPDAVLLDVQMPGMTGLDVVQALAPNERPAIVFVTAYDTYALRAFELSAVDYLLKPYDATRLAESVRRLRERSVVPSDPRIDKLLELLSNKRAPERLTVRSRDGIELVNVNDIDWLRSEDNYTVLYVGKTEMRIRETLSELERRLESHGFIRIHRSVMVNQDRVFRLEPWAHGEYTVILRNGTRLRSGRTYNESLAHLLS